MMNIKFGKMELLHSYQKHGLNKSKILAALEKGIKDIVPGKQNHTLIFTMDYIVVVIDQDNKFLTAFKSNKYQYQIKTIKGMNGGK